MSTAAYVFVEEWEKYQYFLVEKCAFIFASHYANKPIQIYGKFYNQKSKILR